MASGSRLGKELQIETYTNGPNWLELPREVTQNILQRLSVVEIVTSVCLVCPLWWNICKEPVMWRTIDLGKIRRSSYDLANICMYAISRSRGQVEDINIEYFGNDHLLKFIGFRTSNLRRLRIAKSLDISDKVFIDVAKKFALLEELEIAFNNLNKDSLEAIGKNCPHLKTLKYNRTYKGIDCTSYKGFKYDGEAFAIAKNMPQLTKLQLWGNKLTNDGLIAILDSCPNLEFLDLRYCYNVVLCGSLGKRCYETIKDLRHPNEHIFENDGDNDDHLYEYYCECRITRKGRGMTKMGKLKGKF